MRERVKEEEGGGGGLDWSLVPAKWFHRRVDILPADVLVCHCVEIEHEDHVHSILCSLLC